jgi:ribosomal protein S18 acetylase RimI-like enzyme
VIPGIRAYQLNDKQAVLQLLALNTPKYFDPSEAAGLANYLDNEAERYFVAEQDGNIVGCGGYNTQTTDGADVRICWDIIHPDYQGKGIGSALLKFRIDEIRKRPEVQKITVRTSQLTFAFYEKNGFRLESVEKDYWAKGFDLYYMVFEPEKSA